MNRRKLVVIGLLAALLAYVAWPGQDADSSDQVVGEATPALAGGQPAGGAGGKDSVGERYSLLPRIDLAQLLAHNPFLGEQTPVRNWRDRQEPVSGSGPASDVDTPAAEPALDVAAEAVPTLEALRAVLRVNAIVTGGARPAALIGDSLFYENDHLGKGWRIRTIHPDKVVVEKTE